MFLKIIQKFFNGPGKEKYQTFSMTLYWVSAILQHKICSTSINKIISTFLTLIIKNLHSNCSRYSSTGRLYISSEDGRLRDGTYDKLYTFGGRGFSVLRSDTMERIYDSGSSFEDSHALRYPKLFNSYAKSSANITDTFDTRSDSKVRKVTTSVSLLFS